MKLKSMQSYNRMQFSLQYNQLKLLLDLVLSPLELFHMAT